METAEKVEQLKLRRWMLVINNPTFKESETIWDLAKSNDIKGLIWSAEHAHGEQTSEAENKTEHYHIYINFKIPWRFKRIQTLFPRAHIEPARKETLACARYVAKEGFYMIFGNIPDPKTDKNSRTQTQKAKDLERTQIVENIRKGKLRFQDLTSEQLLDTKLVKAVKEAIAIAPGPKRPEIYTCVFVSPTGWGKSYSVWDTFKNVAQVEFGGTQEWFIDAEQEIMLFDEFCGQVRVQKMLRYLDMYPISLPIKGGHRPCYWKLIFICSNTPPQEWYMKENQKTGEKESSIPEEVRQALYRRIGYPEANERGETHIYLPPFSNKQDAQKEMHEICEKLHKKMYEQTNQPQTEDEIIQTEADQRKRPRLQEASDDIDVQSLMQDYQNSQIQWQQNIQDFKKKSEEHEQFLLEMQHILQLHNIDIQQEERKWDKARQIQQERLAHQYDDLPPLEPGTPNSEQDPEATIPQLEDIPEDISDDSDFEKN